MINKGQRAQFGKYKGRLISWIVENDYNYALWLMKQSNSTTKTKRTSKSLVDTLLPKPTEP
jgi:uncharacterized protein (DUF3820 family)